MKLTRKKSLHLEGLKDFKCSIPPTGVLAGPQSSLETINQLELGGGGGGSLGSDLEVEFSVLSLLLGSFPLGPIGISAGVGE